MDDDVDDDMGDFMYHYNDHNGVVFQVPTVKIPMQCADWIHTLVMLASSISSAFTKHVLQVLFDSGGAKTMIHQRVLPKNF